tara:strand:+ start:4344 stop:5255 length:912 start_codon:yes stop_codon:yes gene_type:complete
MKRFLLPAALLVAALAGPQANAASILVNDFQIDLAAAGEGTGIISPIDEITFRGIAHNQTTDTNMNGFQDPGELSIIDGLGSVTSFQGNGGPQNVSSTGEILSVDYELTFDFTVGGVGTGLLGGVSTFTHTAPGVGGADGLLDFYVDGTPDAVLDLGVGGVTASGLTNGTLIATFEILAGDGGVINGNTLDGSDDATFQLISAMPGVLLDADGNDLGLLVKGGAEVLLAFSNSNFDLDADNDGLINSGPPAGWPFPRIGSGSPVDHFALEDGSLNLATVPEPASLLGFAAIGAIGIAGRRRRR